MLRFLADSARVLTFTARDRLYESVMCWFVLLMGGSFILGIATGFFSDDSFTAPPPEPPVRVHISPNQLQWLCDCIRSD